MHFSIRALLCATLLGCAALAHADSMSNADLQAQVANTERAFAQTMAARDHAAFTRFVADDAIFINGADALRGKAAIAAAWQPLYAKPEAPFSWQPSLVEVNAAGTLAISRGPVFDPSGKLVSGFSSIWRREPAGNWKIIFDQGTDVRACDLEAKP